MLSAAPPYHLKVLDHFKQQRSTWDFFAAAGTREEQLVSFKTDLLKNTYKFQPGTDPQLYEKIALAKDKLGLGELPVTAYQAQYTEEGNASILYFHGEAHLVFSGDLTQRLNEEELLAVIAHELTHIKLYTLCDGELEVADRIITAIDNNNNSSSSYVARNWPSGNMAHFPQSFNDGPSARASVTPYYETARLFRLYTEIFCDRGALAVLGDTTPVINMLLKIATGLPVVHAESYRQQAEEIFSASPATRSVTGTHPENFIRTHALRLWFEKKEAAEPEITRMIEGLPELDRLDIFSQKELAVLTRDFLSYYLRPQWFQSTLVTSLARQYFPDLYEERPAPPASRQGQMAFPEGFRIGSAGDLSVPDPEQMALKLADAHNSIREYFAYLLLDFVLVDPSLEEIPSGRAFQLAEEMQLSAVYDPIAKKELQLSDKKWAGYKQQTQAAYAALKED